MNSPAVTRLGQNRDVSPPLPEHPLLPTPERVPRFGVGRALLLLSLLIGLCAVPGHAGDLSGLLSASRGRTDRDDLGEEDTLDANLSMRYQVELTAFLSALVSLQATRFESEDDSGLETERRTTTPYVELRYQIPGFSVKGGYYEQRRRGSLSSDRLDSKSLFGELGWQPEQGPDVLLRYRNDENTADIGVFGQDNETEIWDLLLDYTPDTYSLRYAFQDLSLVNNISGFQLGQSRHTLRATTEQAFLDERLWLSADIEVGRVEREESAPTGTLIFEPVSRRTGLFAIDTTPDFGELDPLPGLIDGDRDAPTVPAIEIGGASTFRNVGLDLGSQQFIDRLEIYVDALSSPGLLWEIYTSTDNLNWVPLPATLSTFDDALLRYVIDLPAETRARYVKAVNVSPNTEPFVAVTEMRALVETRAEESSRDRSNLVRAFVNGRYELSERAGLELGFGLRDDSSEVETGLRRDQRELDAELAGYWDLARDLRGDAAYYWSRSERVGAPAQSIRESRWTTGLTWTPLPAFTGRLSAARREERSFGELTRRTDTVQARAYTELYPDLAISSEISYYDSEDPAASFSLSSIRIAQSLEGRPTSYSTLAFGAAYERFDSVGTIDLEDRVQLFLRASWNVLPSLNFSTNVSYSDETRSDTLSERFSLSWTPGDKFVLSASYSSTDSSGVAETEITSGNLRYRLTRRTFIFVNAARSRTATLGVDPTTVTSARAGFSITI